MENENAKSVLSEKLHRLIYNPELPQEWKILKDNKKVIMFHTLFVLLNEECQKQTGKIIDEWLSLLSTVDEGKDIPENPWMTIVRRRKGNEVIVQYGMKSFEFGIEKKHQLFPHIVYELLVKREIKDLERTIPFKTTVDIFSHDKSVFDVVELAATNSYIERNVTKDVFIYLYFQKYLQDRREGYIPSTIFPAVKINCPKKQLMRDFEEYVDHMQDLYFKQVPDEKGAWLGHPTYKSDGRLMVYPFEEWARYFKVYILYTLGKKQKEIAEELFRGDVEGSGESKISQDLRKARNLIKNAWIGDFPGNYS